MARRPPTATVTTGEAENTEEVEAVVAGAEEGGADNGSDGAGGIHELQTTTKPPGKPWGRQQRRRKRYTVTFLSTWSKNMTQLICSLILWLPG